MVMMWFRYWRQRYQGQSYWRQTVWSVAITGLLSSTCTLAVYDEPEQLDVELEIENSGTDTERVLDYLSQMEAGDSFVPPERIEPAIPARKDLYASIRSLTLELLEHGETGMGVAALHSLAGMVAITLADGMLTSYVASQLNTLISSHCGLYATAGAVGSYGALALSLSYLLLKKAGYIDDLGFRNHMQIILESIGAGYGVATVTWLTSNYLWGWIRESGFADIFDMFMVGRLMEDRFSREEFDGYNSAVHFILGRIGGGLAYYMLRIVSRGNSLRIERDELEDELASLKQLLTRLDQETVNTGNSRLFNPEAASSGAISPEAISPEAISPETDQETDFLPVPGRRHNDENPQPLVPEADLHPAESDQSETDLL